MSTQVKNCAAPRTLTILRSRLALSVVSGVTVAAIGGTFATILMFQGEMNRLAGRLEGIKQMPEPAASAAKQEVSDVGSAAEIVTIIRDLQRQNVKESWGEATYQCFTDEDLNRFLASRTTDRITSVLRHDRQFLRIVDSLRKMEAAEQITLLSTADKPLRPTWAQLGQVSRAGTTEAGQKAEQLIASAIANLARELSAP